MVSEAEGEEKDGGASAEGRAESLMKVGPTDPRPQ